MVDFFLELGTEEIPAFSVEPACRDLLQKLTACLAEAGLDAGETRTAATPRRLALWVAGLAEKQPDREEEVSGPSEKAAFDKEGNPTKAAAGFAKGQGVSVDQIEVRDTPKGRYCFALRKIKGEPASRVLAGLLPRIIADVHFPKSMRWPAAGGKAPAAGKKGNETRTAFTFSRPIRTIAALLGNEVVPFEISGVEAGRMICGHPFLAPEPFEIESADFDLYLDALKERFVIADVEERRALVRSGVEKILEEHGGVLKEKKLIDEVTHLVEFPAAVEGVFDERFLSLPADVVKSAMMDHQRYFPVEDGGGNLKPRFITVINRGRERADGIRLGNERVLAARLSDAEFFLTEDRKTSLGDRFDSLDEIVYQEKLGTYRDRVKRLSSLAGFLAGVLELTKEEKEDSARAALLCKCDLTTEMVGEFPGLQGIVGREYALMDGEKSSVAAAVEEHYLPRYAGDRLPATTAGKVLALAEKFDAITGCFAAGLSPTGSQDPYGLRRQALGVLRILLEGGVGISLKETVRSAAAGLPSELAEAADLEKDVLDFFRDRLYHFSVERKYRYDLVNAALATGFDDVHVFQKRLEAVTELAADPGWDELVTVVQRTFNIYRNAQDPGAPKKDLLAAAEEKELFRLFGDNEPAILGLVKKGDFKKASREYAAAFVEPVHVFFDKVFVNVDDSDLKKNRLALMKALNSLYSSNIADLSCVAGDTTRNGV